MEDRTLIIGRTSSGLLVPVSVDINGSINNVITLPIPAGTNLIGAVGLTGYYSGGWRKAPLPWGASADYGINWQNLSLPAGASNQDSGALTANAFTIITSWSVKYVGTVTNVILDLIRMDGGGAGTPRTIQTFRALTTNVWVNWNGFIVCKSNDILRVAVTGATLNDDLYVSTNGYYLSLNL